MADKEPPSASADQEEEEVSQEMSVLDLEKVEFEFIDEQEVSLL